MRNTQKKIKHSLFNITILRRFIELYKLYHNLSQTSFNDLFTRSNNFYNNLPWKSDFVIPQIRIVLKTSNSIKFYGPIIWCLVPVEIRYTNSLEKSKNKIWRWKTNVCTSRICKNYISNVGFQELCSKIIFGMLFI